MRRTNSGNSLQILVGELTRTRSQSSFDFSFGSKGSSKTTVQTIELDIDVFESFVVDTLAPHIDASAEAVYTELQFQVKRLYQHASTQGDRLCSYQAQRSCPHCSNTKLAEIALSLKTIIEMSPQMPARITAQVHSSIGLLIQKQGNLKGAIQSFLKALWIQSSLSVGVLTGEEDANNSDTTSTATDDALDMALTRHRLGVAYGKSGDFLEAATILEKAVQGYDKVIATGDAAAEVFHRKLLEACKTELGKFEEAAQIEATLPGLSTKKINRRTSRRRRSTRTKLDSAGINMELTRTDSDLRRSSTEQPKSGTAKINPISRSLTCLATIRRKAQESSSNGNGNSKANFQW